MAQKNSAPQHKARERDIKSQITMANDQPSLKSQNTDKVYDLEERTLKFSQNIVDFCKKIPLDTITRPIVNQLIRSGTSIGANYSEADEANSKKDFINKIAIAKKETKETKYWLRVIAHAVPKISEEARKLWKEVQEFNLIFAAIIRSANKNKS